MAARRKVQEERTLKLLRELASSPANKQCFDCHQRGPTYVNVTIGSFVCTSCSGILRGLHPPHRVKSITMTSFTPEEIEFIKSRGNEFCRYVWLGTYDSGTAAEPDIRDEQRIRDFMIQKYERKRWYLDPDVAMRKMQQENPKYSQNIANDNTAAIPEVRPLSGLLGEQPSPLVIENAQQHSVWGSSSTHSTLAAHVPSKPKVPSSVPHDFNKDIADDPFQNTPFNDMNSTANGNFANFEDAFNNANSAHRSDGGNSFVPMTSTVVTVTTASTTPALGIAASQPPQSVPPASFDRYAALADLDSLFHQEPAVTSQPPPTSNAQNWAAATSATAPFSLTSSFPTFFAPVSSNPFSNTTSTYTFTSGSMTSQPPSFSPSNPFQLFSGSTSASTRPANAASQFGVPKDEFSALALQSSSPLLTNTVAGQASPLNGNHLNGSAGGSAVFQGWNSSGSQALITEPAFSDFSNLQSNAAGAFVGWTQPQVPVVQNASNPFALEVGSTNVKPNPSNPFL